MQDMADNEGKYTLGCKHSYHPRCITTWLAQSNKCPYCRTTIDETAALPVLEPRTCGLSKQQWARCARTTWAMLVGFSALYMMAMMMGGMVLIGFYHMPTPEGTILFLLGSVVAFIPMIYSAVGRA